MQEPHQDLTFTGKRLELAVPYQLSGKEPRPSHAFFLHIPKTGGTSLHFCLSAALQAVHGENEIPYARFRVARIPGQSPVMMTRDWRGSQPVIEGLENKQSLTEKFNIFSAHSAYGMHTSLGLDHAQYITIVRDPYDREISSFNFLYQKGYLDEGASLKDMVASRVLLDNPQTRMIAGNSFMEGECTDAVYEQAIRNIESDFCIATTSDHVHEAIQTILAIYDLSPVAYVRSQVTGLKIIANEDQNLRQQVENYHSYDKRLVEYVAKRWGSWKNAHITGQQPVSSSSMITIVGPDYFERRKPHFVRLADLPEILEDTGLASTRTLDL